ncbi:peptidoglycan recognition family protein [Microbulbifer sp. SSSA002]|uniref:peptidoglycan recognition protein family protein n=1 Tax=Microbulbifer sp. SSSA002 TaxID=3243376 RepID=UPI00403A710C
MHFLIDESGKIFQTASLTTMCWYVGRLYSKCRTLKACSAEEARHIEGLLKTKNASWGARFKLVTDYELKKDYPLRYPHNHDFIGIEVVGLMSKENVYETPSEAQVKSLIWLLGNLVEKYGLTLTDLYAHGKIAHKDPKRQKVLRL